MPVLNVQIPNAPQDLSQVTEEAQMLGQSGKLDYIFGLFYFRESGTDEALAYNLITNVATTQGAAKNTSYSPFLHTNYKVSSLMDGLSLTGGVRLNTDDRQWTNRNLIQTGASAYTCRLTGLKITSFAPSLCSYPVGATFKESTWDVGLNESITPNSLIYFLVSHGYRAGGFSAGATSVALNVPYQPEKIDNYEIGSKNDFNIANMPMRFNASVYHDKYVDIQRTVSTVIGGVLNNLTINAARAHIEGAELELTLKPTPALELTANYAYVFPKYDSFTDIVADRGVNYPINVADSQFILNSRNSFNVGVHYKLPTNDQYGTASAQAHYSYRSSFYTTSDINTANCHAPSDPNIPPALYTNCLNHAGKLPGYGLLNLRADWVNFMGKRLDVSAFIENATNKYYYSSANNALNSVGGLAAFIGPPRMFGVEFKVPFGAGAH
jgi:iron complex outermembrane receptor protein